MRAFTGEVIQTGFQQSLVSTAPFEIRHFRIEFFDFDFSAAAVDEIISSVIIEQNRCIMIHAVEFSS